MADIFQDKDKQEMTQDSSKKDGRDVHLADAAEHHEPLTGILGWIDYRLPIISALMHFRVYKIFKNLNYLWNLGLIAGIVLMI